MNFDPETEFFDFEQDFAGTLRCIPMRVRLKLDLCAIKLSLRQWSQLTSDERKELLHRACETAAEQKLYHEQLMDLIVARCDEPPRTLKQNDDHLWRNTELVPDCVLSQAKLDAVIAPSLDQWRALHALQRFALVKLARSKHENENYVPALIEFGLAHEGSLS
ncbi:nitrate reductase associated protein [Asaia astilbis]|uniref:nitrate reductase associated protein n=1 Tax=Asaia astilbis TaxID=610244 RepID=UPI00046F52AD|nr:nitrate reductase associated protein [Asaia astilbis]